MKVKYIGKTYKIQEIELGSEILYAVARNDNRRVYTAFIDLEEAKKLWRNLEGEK